MNVQIIAKNGKPEWAVIPFQDYKKIHKCTNGDDLK